MDKAQELYDLDGRPYIDVYTGSGAGLMGNGHPRIKEAVQILEVSRKAAHAVLERGEG